MENKVQKMLCQTLWACLWMSVPALPNAQNSPDQWTSFVSSADNRALSDTFRIQSFEKNEVDSWAYEVPVGEVHLIDASLSSIKGQGGRASLQLPLGATVRFEAITEASSPYQNVRISLLYAGHDLMKSEHLTIQAKRETPLDRILTYVNKDHYSFNYRENTKDQHQSTNANPMQVTSNPQDLTLLVSPAAAPANKGFYCLDSVYAFGLIPAYSLFNGDGDWLTAARWSHAPALRHRSALVKGQVSVTTDVQCKRLAISDGGVHVSSGASLQLEDLELYGEGNALTASGTFRVHGQIAFHKTFQKKGCWYFLSFPFDVYPAGLDAAFRLGDEQTSDTGNYLYVKQYDANKREQLGKPVDNWIVLPAATMHAANQPLFKRGEGYLVALDAAATAQTLTFSSKGGTLPDDFAQSGRLTITGPHRNNAGGNAHSGWQLCGNPLPTSLPLKQLGGSSALGGSVYLYNGTDYTVYPMTGDYVLPPFSAFFIKSTAPAEVVIIPDASSTKGVLLPASLPMQTRAVEPIAADNPASLTLPSGLKVYRQGDRLMLEGLPAAGTARLSDINGRQLHSYRLTAGINMLRLPSLAGIYLLQVEAGGYRAQYKVRIVL